MTEASNTSECDFAWRYDEQRVIRGRVTRSGDGPQPAVIVVHGFKGFLRWGFFPELQERIARNGMVSVAINLSGSGVGEDLENFTEDEAFFRTTASRDIEDVDRVRQLIEEASDEDAVFGRIDASRLALFGHSRGGGTVLLSAERSGAYRAVATWASVPSTDPFDDEVKAKWRASGVLEVPNARTGQVHRISTDALDDGEANADALNVEAACSRSATPTLLVHGTDDQTVPYSGALLLKQAFQPDIARLVEIDGGGHTFGAVHPYQGTTPELEAALDATLGFLRERLT